MKPAQPMDIYPLMINCDGSYIGGASWFHHHEKFAGSSMTRILRSCFRRFLRREEYFNRFFYSEIDVAMLEEQKIHHGESKRELEEPSMSGLKDSKEELAEEVSLDLENR